MSLRPLLAVALLLSPAIAARDVLDMTGGTLEANDLSSNRKVLPAEWLAYSWEPDHSGVKANMLRRKKRIFSYGDDDIDYGPSSYGNYEWVKSDSLVETSDKIAAAVSIGGSFGPAFAASVSAGMDAASSTKSKQFRSDLFVTAKKYHASSKALYPEKNLRPEVRNFLVTKSPEEIIEMFGAFYASTIELGGLVRSTITKTASENEDLTKFQSKAEVATTLVTVQDAVGSNFEKHLGKKNSNSEMSIKVSTLGGDSESWLGMRNDASLTEIQENWAESINEENVAPIRFTLKPLWSLLEDIDCQECQDRANALKLELTKRWDDDLAKLKEQDNLPRRVPGQVDDDVTFIPVIFPEKRMFVGAEAAFRSHKWSQVGKSRDRFKAFEIKKAMAFEEIADPNKMSFESVASRGQYIAACKGLSGTRYVCHRHIITDSDKRRATWSMVNGFEPNTKSFQSLFYPGYYMDLEIEKSGGGATSWVRLSEPGEVTFRRGASWKLEFVELAS